MAKKVTLGSINGKIDTLTAMLGDVVEVFGKRFDRLEGRIDGIDQRMATKVDMVRVQEQVTSIEQQLKHGRYEIRLTKLEERVFG